MPAAMGDSISADEVVVKVVVDIFYDFSIKIYQLYLQGVALVAQSG